MAIRIRAKDPHGFDVWLDLQSLDDIGPMVRQLLAKGYTPASSGTGTGEWVKTPDDRYLCPRHRTVMQHRAKNQDQWWSHKLLHPVTKAELYCRGYRYGPAEKDGFLIDP